MTALWDTHCHLTHARFGRDSGPVVERAREAGLAGCVTIGTGVDDARAAQRLAAEHRGFVHCTAGIDPFTAHRLGDGFSEALDELRALLAGGGFIGLGEVGLDYHHDLGPPALQARRLEQQLDLAVDLDLPVVIHVRDAHADMAAVLARRPHSRGVIHSFTAGPREAQAYLDLGFYLAFNGVLTFPDAAGVREAARMAPPDRIVLETDSPYLAPVPQRGARCEPAHVVHTLARLAEIRAESPDALARITTRNARALFGV